MVTVNPVNGSHHILQIVETKEEGRGKGWEILPSRVVGKVDTIPRRLV